MCITSQLDTQVHSIPDGRGSDQALLACASLRDCFSSGVLAAAALMTLRSAWDWTDGRWHMVPGTLAAAIGGLCGCPRTLEAN